MKKILFALLAALMTIPTFAQQSLTQTTLSASINANQTLIYVASATGIDTATLLYVDNEALRVTGVNGTSISVVRGSLTTQVVAHNSGATVYAGPAGANTPFFTKDLPLGACTNGNGPFVYSPTINVANGKQWTCVNGKTTQIVTNSTPNTVVLGCDSISAINGQIVPSGSPTNSRVESAPNAVGYFDWSQALDGQRLTLVNNAGASGDTTTLFLARMQTDVLAYHPKYAVILCGINDVNGGSSAAAIESNLQLIYYRLIHNGTFVIAASLPPWSFGETAPEAAVWAQVNEWIHRTATSSAGMAFVDFTSPYIDTTNAQPVPLANTTSDGLHPDHTGAFLLGKNLATVVSNLVPPAWYGTDWNGDTFSATNLTGSFPVNPLMTGSAGTVTCSSCTGGTTTGTAATSWGLKGASLTTGMSCVGSTVSASDGIGFYQQIQTTGLGLTNTCLLSQTVNNSVVSGTYISGGSAPSSGTGTCTLTISQSGASNATATVPYANGVLTPGPITVSAGGSAFWQQPTSAAVSGTSGCSGTATISSSLTFNPGDTIYFELEVAPQSTLDGLFVTITALNQSFAGTIGNLGYALQWSNTMTHGLGFQPATMLLRSNPITLPNTGTAAGNVAFVLPNVGNYGNGNNYFRRVVIRKISGASIQ